MCSLVYFLRCLGSLLPFKARLGWAIPAVTLLALSCRQEGALVVATVVPSSPIPVVTPTSPVAECPQEGDLMLAQEATLLLVGRGSMGTAVVVDQSGKAVTAAHLVSEGEVVALLVPQDGMRAVAARVAAIDEERGVALLVMEPLGPFPSLAWRPADVTEGEGIVVIGYPQGRFQLSPIRIHSFVFRYLQIEGERYLQFPIDADPGLAGAPVVDQCGFLVGIVVFRVRGVPGLVVAVASSSAQMALQESVLALPPQRHEEKTLLALARAKLVQEDLIPLGQEASLSLPEGPFLALLGRCPTSLYCQNVHFFLGERYLGTDTLRPSRSILAVEADAERGWIKVTYASYAPGDPDDSPSRPPVTIPYWWDGQRLRASGVPPGH